MRRKLLVYCEQCGGADMPRGEVVFHALSFCSPGCRDDYRSSETERREARRAIAELATVADVMRRHNAAASRPAKRKRAA